jgi:AraC family transcriptional regulator
MGDFPSFARILWRAKHIAGISPYYFSRAFKTSTGLSPHQYRVEAAKRLLIAGELSLSEIAFLV